ncbi:putative N6-adenine methyltransferase-domain-containing protein [Scheffersomyces coipomensis]|uniref:putative N6-adenine methyltransferase-domain-containing protein n=1 Tax=Scheffersomyces coipomensis TaxID=1788519 RepID=UPI00315D58CB
MDSDDEPITLSAHALAALMEFKKEENDRIERFESLQKAAQDRFEKQQKISIDEFKEDWQLSQFWYTDETAAILGKALLEGADEDTVIAIASAPSVYAAIINFPPEEIPTKHIYLLEYDTRFEVLGGDHFSFYDYNEPSKVPVHLQHKCHRLLIDPPFLEEECQTKSAQAAKNLLVEDHNEKTKKGDLKFKIISSTGERMREVVKKNYPDTTLTSFLPQHKNGLSNEFRCYASFECSHWKFE